MRFNNRVRDLEEPAGELFCWSINLQGWFDITISTRGRENREHFLEDVREKGDLTIARDLWE